MIDLSKYKKVRIPLGTFGGGSDELQARLEIGIVEWDYIITTDKAQEPKGSIRHAVGTRNLTFDFIDFDDIPMGVVVPPAHVLTYFDTVRDKWRCCVRSTVMNISDTIYIPD